MSQFVSSSGSQFGDEANLLSAADRERVGLESLQFDNRFSDELPLDESGDNRPRQVSKAASSTTKPARSSGPLLVSWSKEVSDLLEIRADFWTDHSEIAAQVFSGNATLPGMRPIAARYGGHQFGNWAGQLGDGRAMSLGEVVVGGTRSTLQLKGAGPTPYSRGADGFAVMRSSIREFLCSEAMHHLGVPTTRALSLVSTGDKVRRDMFYDGNPAMEDGAVVCRVAPSFIRFGSFQIFAAMGELEELRAMLDFTINHYFHDLAAQHAPGSNARYEALFADACRSTLDMVVHWMRVGFVHGVMNTDNMSIHGLTIDYGPYGWLDNFDPSWTPNTTDAAHRRYRFGNQPQIAQWNLLQLANAIVQVTKDVEPLQRSLEAFGQDFDLAHRNMWRSKIGLGSELVDEASSAVDNDIDELANDLLELLSAAETDMTLFFRRLADCPISDVSTVTGEDPSGAEPIAALQDAYYDEAEFAALAPRLLDWRDRYAAITNQYGLTDRRRQTSMNSVNPCYVLRNYLSQVAIDAAENGDFSEIELLVEALRTPYVADPRFDRLGAKRPEWARNRPGCSTLSCSS